MKSTLFFFVLFAVVGVLVTILSTNLVTSSSSHHENDDMHINKLFKLLHQNHIDATQDWKSRISSWPLTNPVNTTIGPIIGATDKENITVFLGVPFGKNTSGNLRWAPPQAPEYSPTPRKTTWFGEACPQSSPKIWGIADGQGEDCLNLNIYAPSNALTSSKKLPVMFWIYGGCYKLGSSSLWYNGANNLVNGGGEQQVIYVTFNYRVSTLGFLSGFQLQESSPDGSTGTWGVQDQRLALQWVKDNIANFGGDPDQITVFGESAGAGSTSIFLTSPQTWHLFDKVIMESGNVGSWVTQTMQDGNRSYIKTAQEAGCPLTPYNASVACMRSKPWEFFASKDNHGATPSSAGPPGSFTVACNWAPTVDGVAIKMSPFDAHRQGILAPVPVLSGTNRDEGTYFMSSHDRKTLTPEQYAQKVSYRFGPVPAKNQILPAYPVSSFENVSSKEATASWQALAAVGGDFAMTCPNRQLAFSLAQTSQQRQEMRRHRQSSSSSFASSTRQTNTYLYNYQYQETLTKIFAGFLGVFHMTELFMVWDWHLWLITKTEKELSKMFVTMWTNFATFGDPNGNSTTGKSPSPSPPQWTPFTAKNSSASEVEGDVTFLIRADDENGPYGINEEGFRKKRCDMWESLDGY